MLVASRRQGRRVEQPLQVDSSRRWTLRPGCTPSDSIHVLDALGHHPSSPITLSADYRTLDTIAQPAHRLALCEAALNQALASPAAPGGRRAARRTSTSRGSADHGLGAEVADQLSLSSDALDGDSPGATSTDPVLLTGAPSPAASQRSATAPACSEVVLPEGDLTVAPVVDAQLGSALSRRRRRAGHRAQRRTVRSPRSFKTPSIEPGPSRGADARQRSRSCTSRRPTPPSTAHRRRSSRPSTQTSRTFVTTSSQGFARDPFSQLATLAPSFNPALVGTNGAPDDAPARRRRPRVDAGRRATSRRCCNLDRRRQLLRPGP